MFTLPGLYDNRDAVFHCDLSVLMAISHKRHHILYLCTEYPSHEKQYLWGLKIPSTSRAKCCIWKGVSVEAFITIFLLLWFIFSWISFSTLPHFHIQGTQYYCSCVVVFCLGFSFCAPFQDQGQHSGSLLSTEYPLRDIVHPLWYSINTQWFLNCNVSLKDSCESDCWIQVRVLFPLRSDSCLMFDFCIMAQLHFHVTLG